MNLKRNYGIIINSCILIILALSHIYNYSSIISNIGVLYLWFVYTITTATLILIASTEGILGKIFDEFITAFQRQMDTRFFIHKIILIGLIYVNLISERYMLTCLLTTYYIMYLYLKYKYFNLSKKVVK